jgi:quercetin dioxygenase-like cupin family protein
LVDRLPVHCADLRSGHFDVEEGVDQTDKSIRPYALKAGEGWTYRFGIDFVVKASEVREGSSAAVLEYVTGQGEEPSAHTHETEDEMFYVLEGIVTFQCGQETFDLERGGFVFLPHGTQHSYTIRSERPVRLLVITAPTGKGTSGGWGGFVADMELGQGELVAEPQRSG